MEVSEAISVPPNLDANNNHHIDEHHQPSHSELGFLPSSPDPDPAPSDFDHAVLDDLQKLDLKEKEEEEEDHLDEFQKLDLKEKEDAKEEEEDEEDVEKKSSNGRETENENENENESERQSEQSDGGENQSEDGGDAEKKAEESRRRYQYPVRPEAEDCSYYLKTGSCKFGSNCKFNHPVKRKGSKDKVKEREEFGDKTGQTECKYYLRSGGCKYGKACRYSHSKGKPSVAPVVELNFLGLPIRLGERECPYYMRNGSCKYASNCRFNHPDPTAAGGSDPASAFGNGGPASLQGAPQSTVAPWSAPRSLNETPLYVPMMIPPSQGVPSQNTEWNGYQAPAYLPERSMPARQPYLMSNSVTETNIYKQYPQHQQAEEFPERPGQPFCSYFLRTGDCKFKSNCKYHHPKTQTAVSPQCVLSDKGLPLRPDQNICTHYSRYGICKFGPVCKFDHSENITSSTTSGPDHQLPFSDSATTKGTDAISQLQPV